MLEDNGSASTPKTYRLSWTRLDCSYFTRNGRRFVVLKLRLSSKTLWQVWIQSITIVAKSLKLSLNTKGKQLRKPKRWQSTIWTKVGIPDAEKRLKEYPFQYLEGCANVSLLRLPLPVVRYLDLWRANNGLDVTIQAQIIDLLKTCCKMSTALLLSLSPMTLV